MLLFISAMSAFFLVQGFVLVLWWAAYRVQKTSIIDIFWGLLILASAIVHFYFLSSQQPFSYFCLLLLVFWSFRLALHIYFRGRSHGEDPRYRELREKWGSDEKKKMLIFFFQQGLAAWFFSLPFFILFSSQRSEFSAWEIIGVAIWLVAFNGESISDAQLLEFKKNSAHKGRVCRLGLWKYSRHPNYFFEWLNWVAYAWLALPHVWGWTALACPILMYYFLTRVSGIPFAEKQSLKSKPQEYAEYQRITAPFFPWFPRRGNLR